ncbi:elongator complex protein 5 [Blastomyces gilchristii SLH14081]|uniref:Elongator complex protein 5 n=1 Tax=Blastomyces gilchristii (strain SLH14081) TaxID=559298 RepID=A0A179UR21_BLAGS|nr:elongator complex protein 5 [Blastomyces gilchristii SLH14081]OAT09517.1 elongator complex protein 5 [Blastomyces gilchristii SLH14081]
MPPTSVSHRRTHNLLLISKLLGVRNSASPLTLLLDSLEQPATPLIREYIRRAKLSKIHIIFVSFETLTRPDGVDTFIPTRRKTLAAIAKEVISAISSPLSPHPSGPIPRRSLVIIDSVNLMMSRKHVEDQEMNLAAYLSSFLGPPPTSPQSQHSTSLIAIYHQDIPTCPQKQVPYAPSPLSLLTYLATTILTVHCMSHILAEKVARDRSLMAPIFGLAEEADGVIIGRRTSHSKSTDDDSKGLVIEMEHRRKSGRGIVEWYYLPPAAKIHRQQVKEVVILLDDHPLYRREEEQGVEKEGWEPESTFELGLTERQRLEREGVVLPYFDAQKGDGPGEGGRILYDMGEEDDFDEEEDEI